MRFAILALAAGLLMIAGSTANACDKCAQHANYAYGKSYGCKSSAKRPLGLRSKCGGYNGGQPALFNYLQWHGQCGCCGHPGLHGLAGRVGGHLHGHLGLHGGAMGQNGMGAMGQNGMPIGPGGPYTGPSGPTTATYGYPYYTTRGPRDFLMDNPPTIGR